MLPKAYDPKAVEDRIYRMWEESGAFKANAHSNKRPFTISMPPPNATGNLHLGHAVMLALEDIFIRFQRMRGKEALWVPGTDHAAIATNAVMERRLIGEGTSKAEVGREEFIRRLTEYIEQSRNTIRSQIRKMGCSCDWSRERYTMDDSLSRCVSEVFKKMYGEGLIYRANRIVNWCPHCKSTLSDDEVVYDKRQETFYTIRYGPITIGTVRPETKFGDTAVAVHPDDLRYKEYVGKEIEVETGIGKAIIRVISDEAVDPNFGTGALKVTPAHDFKDFEMAQRHHLDVVQVIGEDGRMMEQAGPFKGMTTRECREAMNGAMRSKGILVNEEPYTHNLSVCYRCMHPVEPLPKLQWFIDVNKKVVPWGRTFGIFPQMMSLKGVMQDVVRSKKITIIPERFEKTYFHWIDNLRDWCISRQIWWGHRIPVWYCVGDDHCLPDCKQPMVSVQKPAECPHCHSKNLGQDPDTLDTWFSSALWTWSTLVDPKKAADFTLSLDQILAQSPDYQKFHPTQVMETGYDILFFWVARMILMTTYATGRIPFETVYLHGLIRTRDGKKMSKSDPETMIDPLDIIPKYGADALRLSMIVGQSPGSDSRLYEEKIAGYRNFVNKLWNASRFVLMQCEEAGVDPRTIGNNGIMEYQNNGGLSLADRAILSELQQLIRDVTDGLEKYRLSEVGERLYAFVWDRYCDWYVEFSKNVSEDRRKEVCAYHVYIIRMLCTLLHPYTPFVTEELWSQFTFQGSGMLISEPWPVASQSLDDKSASDELQMVIDVITAIRSIRSEYNVMPGKKVNVVLVVEARHASTELSTGAVPLQEYVEHVKRLARVEGLTIQGEKFYGSHAVSAFTKHAEVHVPLEGLIDVAKEKERLTKEKQKLESFLRGVQGKLGNKEFTRNAPEEVISKERQKEEDAQGKMKKLEEKLALLG
jgi:valyl-tRNA synthetase